MAGSPRSGIYLIPDLLGKAGYRQAGVSDMP